MLVNQNVIVSSKMLDALCAEARHVCACRRVKSRDTHSSEGEGIGPGVSSDRAPPAGAAGVLWPCPCCLPAGVLGGVDLAAVGVAC